MPFIGGLIAGGGSLLGGLFGSNAASSAAKTQAQANQNAINAQLGVDQTIQGQLSPFLNAGTNALRQLQGGLGGVGSGAQFAPDALLRQEMGLGFNLPNYAPQQLKTEQLNIPDPSNPNTIRQFQQSPGYQYNLGQQQQAIQQSAPGRTGALSGNMLQALQSNASGLANQDYYNWLGQATNFGLQNFNAGTQNDLNTFNANTQTAQNSYNALSGNFWNVYDALAQGQGQNINALQNLSQMGLSAGANLGQIGTNLGSNIGQSLIGQGNALAGGQIGSATALAGGLGGAAGAISNAFTQPNQTGSGFNALAYLFGAGGGNPSGGYSGSPGNYNYYGPGVDPSLSY
jgi:hypothetical protein